MSRPRKAGQGVRRLVTISQKNAAFLQWWDEQESPSTSLALVLADWIERHGFVDVVNRPVHQLPRRGRPPAGASNTHGFLDDQSEHEAPPEQSTAGDHRIPGSPKPHELNELNESSEPHDDASTPEPGRVASNRTDGDRADEVLAHAPAALPAEAPPNAAARSTHTSQKTMRSTPEGADRIVLSEKTPVRVLSDGAPEQLDMNSIFGH